jgi:hypothetical protein
LDSDFPFTLLIKLDINHPSVRNLKSLLVNFGFKDKLPEIKEALNFSDFCRLTEIQLDPLTGKPYRRRGLKRQLEQIRDEQVAKGVDLNALWLNYSDLPRLNVYPSVANRLNKSTPSGIYAYPLQLIIDKTAPYAGERAYAIVFRSRSPIWDIGKNREDSEQPGFKVKTYVLDQDFPEKEKFIKIADELNLDLRGALSNIDLFSNKNQFIYQLAKQLAQQWSKKEQEVTKKFDRLNWPMKWNKILRTLGYDNAVDLQDSSAIHAGEPTQGVFLDTTKLELIAIINNSSHMIQTVSSDSPNYFKYLKYQRKNFFLPYGAKNMSPEEVREKTMLAKTEYVCKSLAEALDENVWQTQKLGQGKFSFQDYRVLSESLKERLKATKLYFESLVKLVLPIGEHILKEVIIKYISEKFPFGKFMELDKTNKEVEIISVLLHKLGLGHRL